MKTSTHKILGWGSALVLIAGFVTSAIAGPGPQYWQQQEQIRAANAKAKAAAVAAQPKAIAVMACGNCKTSVVEEFSALNVSGKYAPHYTPIGARHECASCGGAVATVRGKTTNDMKANCPICAKAKAASAVCCTTTS